MNRTKITKLDIFSVILVICISIPLIILSLNNDDKVIKHEMNNYLYLPDSVKSEVKGFVLRERYIKQKGVTLIDLSNGGKYMLRDVWFIKRDYYIYKPANNDSIYFYDRNNKLVNHKLKH